MSHPERTVYVVEDNRIKKKKRFKRDKKASAFIKRWSSRGFNVLFF